MGPILFNYSFKMEFLPSKKIPHTDNLSRLIPKIREPLEETVIGSPSSKMNIKNVLYNTVNEQPVLYLAYGSKEKTNTG